LFGVSGSEGGPETPLERPFDVEKDLQLFEEANAADAGDEQSMTYGRMAQ
jgi:hypothetical protein